MASPDSGTNTERIYMSSPDVGEAAETSGEL